MEPVESSVTPYELRPIKLKPSDWTAIEQWRKRFDSHVPDPPVHDIDDVHLRTPSLPTLIERRRGRIASAVYDEGETYKTTENVDEFLALVGNGNDELRKLTRLQFTHRLLQAVANKGTRAPNMAIATVNRIGQRRSPPTAAEYDRINGSIVIGDNLLPAMKEDVTATLVGYNTLDALYQTYCDGWDVIHQRNIANQDLVIDLPQHPTTIDDHHVIYGTGFASKRKNAFLIDQQIAPDTKIRYFKKEGVIPKNSFPKDNTRFHLHHIGPRYLYQIDLMFSKPFCYLFAINVNTRYLIVVPMGVNISEGDDGSVQAQIESIQRSGNTYVRALSVLLRRDIRPALDTKLYLKGDGEKAFNSKPAKEVYQDQNIEFIPTTTKGSSHTQLNIVDRVIRTIRDMHYRYARESLDVDSKRYSYIDPVTMEHLVDMYNNSPHETFRKTLGFDISPRMMELDPELLSQFVTRVARQNLEITAEPGYDISIGSIVKVLNREGGLNKKRSKVEDVYFRVIERRKNTFLVQALDDPKRQRWVPRFMLALEE